MTESAFGSFDMVVECAGAVEAGEHVGGSFLNVGTRAMNSVRAAATPALAVSIGAVMRTGRWARSGPRLPRPARALDGERVLQAAGLFVGEEVAVGVQGRPRAVERLARCTAVALDGLLERAPAPIEPVTGQADHVEGVNDVTGRLRECPQSNYARLALRETTVYPRSGQRHDLDATCHLR